jgi:hypothetical protein
MRPIFTSLFIILFLLDLQVDGQAQSSRCDSLTPQSSASQMLDCIKYLNARVADFRIATRYFTCGQTPSNTQDHTWRFDFPVRQYWVTITSSPTNAGEVQPIYIRDREVSVRCTTKGQGGYGFTIVATSLPPE